MGCRFALTVDPENEVLRARMREVDGKRAQGLATVPTTLALERETNPFLRAGSPALRRALALEGADDVAVFARTRALKDAF